MYNCVVCDDTFTPKHKSHLTCGESCSKVIAQNRSSLETIRKMANGKQPYCGECGKLLTLPVNIKRKFCCYECLVSNRKRPRNLKKMTVTTTRTINHCAYCSQLIKHSFARRTPFGRVCSNVCEQLISFGDNGVSDRSVHITRAGCDMPNKVITEKQVELYHKINARKNKKLRPTSSLFMLPNDRQMSMWEAKFKLERKVYRSSSMRLTVEVPARARLVRAYARAEGIGVLFLEPLLGPTAVPEQMVKRSFIYSHMSYEYKDDREATASEMLVMHRVPVDGFKGDEYYLFEITNAKNFDSMLSLQDSPWRMPDLNVRFTSQLFQTKGVSQNAPEHASKFLFPKGNY